MSTLQELNIRVRDLNTKFIIVTGGVCSSIGKGVLIASLGVIVKSTKHTVSVVKCDPYLNVDPGTMSPLVHGEVFVTADGGETDLDLGHYERLIDLNLTKDSSITAGQLYKYIIDQEREGGFLGKCIQTVPHMTDLIKRRLLSFAVSQQTDFVLVEVGGTVGDIEGEIFLEALRQLRLELGVNYFMHAHLSYVPYLTWADEIKTKPTQHSIMMLKKAGLIPDFLFLRTDTHINDSALDKMSLMCGVKRDYIFQVPTVNPVYRAFIELNEQKLGNKIQHYFSLKGQQDIRLVEWETVLQNVDKSNDKLNIAMIVKYVGGNDPYISVVEAIKAAGYSQHHKINLVLVDSQELFGLTKEELQGKLSAFDGIVVPGGFDGRGVEGKIKAATCARENDIPYLGLCLGMQIMVIEAARSLLSLHSANSTEFDQDTTDPVIALLDNQSGVKKGASMRLGSYTCALKDHSKARAIYKQPSIKERHRHRYEVNNSYKDQFEKAGLLFSGLNEDANLIEICEIPGHPFMVGVQFHPEFQSTPLRPHPLFKEFILAALRRKNAQK